MSDDIGAKLAFDRGAVGRRAVAVPCWEGEETPLPDAHLLRDDLHLPELAQGELVRYYTALSNRNFGVDSGPYLLGSCTMKYNPKVNDLIASLPGFADAHPLAPDAEVQGTLAVLHDLQRILGSITGLPAVSLAPAAGAQGELAGILMVKRALEERGELERRRRVLVPDSAHGTNPATAAMAGFTVEQIPSRPDGAVDRDALEAALGDDVAAFMVTLPNTLGLWEPEIEEIVRLVHEAGGYMYGDGANLNAIVGRLRFGDLGFDVVHLNLHKTFSTPHGGGGPGAGPVCTTEALRRFLPAPVVEETDEGLRLQRPEASVGRLQQFHGSVGVLLRAYAYIRTVGAEGLVDTSGNAVLNANYLRALLEDHYDLPYRRDTVMHEVVFAGTRQRRRHNVRTYDIAKRLIDYGVHPPTVYFPLIVEEALMIEPTETESREAIEGYAAAMVAIAKESERDPERVRSAPHTAPIGRLDEPEASRRPVLHWRPSEG
ncbi:MAG: aminomethyl-transferring glycine dehydrogenase subunit GcvPB [Dehalococcoidia bacterium]